MMAVLKLRDVHVPKSSLKLTGVSSHDESAITLKTLPQRDKRLQI